MASNDKLVCHLCDEAATSQDSKTLSCSHWFCKQCTDYLSKGSGTVRRCPMCKNNVAVTATTDEQHNVYVNARHREDDDDSQPPSSANTGLCHVTIYDSVAPLTCSLQTVIAHYFIDCAVPCTLFSVYIACISVLMSSLN